MPGASKRSCEACRKRKKKCDEKQPVCSRCERLGIQCLGSGEKRYTFRYALPSNTNSGSFKRDAWSQNGQAVRVSRPPCNEVSRIGSRLVSVLSVTDPGYSILSFGSFFGEVPRRMEHSLALTAASKVLTSSTSTYYTGAPSLQAYMDYGKALQVLRGDVASASTVSHYINIICAIGLLCLSHNLIGGQRAEYEVHVRGLLYLLVRMPNVELKTDFEKQGITIAWSLVIGECIMDPTIKIDQRLVDRQKRRFGPVAADPAGFTTEFYSLRWENLIPLPAQLHDPVLYHGAIAATYKDMYYESPRLITIAKQLYGAANMTGAQEVSLQYILCDTGNVELLSMSLVLNTTLQMLDPSRKTLAKEALKLISEIMETSARLDRFKPLGTARLPNALCLAWVVAPTAKLKETMREILEEHIPDFRGVTWEDLAGRYERRFRTIRALVRERQLPLRVIG
ncbi:hypothetical protein QQS21_009661 [Conoideocrella luteorostrata]|uniref:Zn(2)-C6 fungal-type domain-containing protein n=1 Tax=Conoideocrella luteorostrata TaxID=1105319 RepID=A0AAJ0FUV6_9HYPO|nr:hypothetical protein QQS21_009661 [Conoideocrella luteorostrata]